jgi:hypothetical protein
MITDNKTTNKRKKERNETKKSKVTNDFIGITFCQDNLITI